MNAMKKLSNQKVWQAIACLACASELWLYLDEFGASEFSGGWLTGPLLRMADLGSLLFLVAAANCSLYRPCGHATLLTVLPVHLDAGSLPMDFQGRILGRSTDHFIGTTGRLLE